MTSTTSGKSGAMVAYIVKCWQITSCHEVLKSLGVMFGRFRTQKPDGTVEVAFFNPLQNESTNKKHLPKHKNRWSQKVKITQKPKINRIHHPTSFLLNYMSYFHHELQKRKPTKKNREVFFPLKRSSLARFLLPKKRSSINLWHPARNLHVSCDRHLTFHDTRWLIGIFVMACFNP